MPEWTLWIWIAIGAYLLFWNLYDVFFAIAASTWKDVLPKGRNKELPTFAIIIPAYKEGELLIETARAALKCDYPKDKFDVFILGQDLDSVILQQLREMPVHLIATGALGSKLEAIRNFFSTINPTHDFMVVLDADNIIESNALRVAAQVHEANIPVVQMARRKVSSNSPISYLDEWNTVVNVRLANPSRMALGLNPVVLGSAMSISISLYKDFAAQAGHTIVEDKMFDLYLSRKHIQTFYTEQSGAIDSIAGSSDAFHSQRQRWVNGRVTAARAARKQWAKKPFNLELFDKWLNTAHPQRSLIIVYTVLYGVVSIFIDNNSVSRIGEIAIILIILVQLLSTPVKYYDMRSIKALLALPATLFSVFVARIKAVTKTENKFVRTPKN